MGVSILVPPVAGLCVIWGASLNVLSLFPPLKGSGFLTAAVAVTLGRLADGAVRQEVLTSQVSTS